MLNIEVGKSYICKPIGVTNEVIGYIEHTYTNTAVVLVESYEQCDHFFIDEKQFRVLVKLTDIYAPVEMVS
ncbi:hypothetical protein [Enterococcus thailandicus]